MSATTIKLDSSVRDRLAALARDRGTTMGALLIEATEHLEREAFFARADDQLQQLRRADPAAWDEDRIDSQQWHESTGRDTLTSQDEPGWWE